jgi:hypothetical protein
MSRSNDENHGEVSTAHEPHEHASLTRPLTGNGLEQQ